VIVGEQHSEWRRLYRPGEAGPFALRLRRGAFQAIEGGIERRGAMPRPGSSRRCILRRR
jgi:hypothetical protein